jgi:hypothetical protein
MSVAVILQALGWVSVVGLVTVHLLIQKGRLPADGTAYRIAGCVASTSVVAAAAAEKIWPVAVLGLLWLRIEVFGHRHHVPEPLIHAQVPARVQARTPGQIPAQAQPAMPALLHGALARRQQPPSAPVPTANAPHPHAPHLHLPHPHLPHPHIAPKTVDRVFKIEMGVVIIIALVLFGFWAEQQRDSFTRDTDYVVCNWIEGC